MPQQGTASSGAGTGTDVVAAVSGRQEGVQRSDTGEDAFAPYGPDGRRRAITGDTRAAAVPSPGNGAASGESGAAAKGAAPEQTGKIAGAGRSDAPDTGRKAAATGSGSDGKSMDNPQVQAEIAKLKATEEKVKAHEAAHKSAGGTLTGPISYTYSRGPDGKQYITGGEVPIKISTGKTPEETINRMDQVIRAALAPADPSPQDRAVASQASSMQLQARTEMATGYSPSGGDKPAATDSKPEAAEGSAGDTDPAGGSGVRGASRGIDRASGSSRQDDSRPTAASSGESSLGLLSREAYGSSAVAGSAENVRQREITSSARDATMPVPGDAAPSRGTALRQQPSLTPSDITGFGAARPVSLYA